MTRKPFSLAFSDYANSNPQLLRKSYTIHSLFCAYAQLRHGLPNGDKDFGVTPDPEINFNNDVIIEKLRELSFAHEEQDESGKFAEYVEACSSSTTKQPQRKIRTKFLIKALLSQ